MHLTNKLHLALLILWTGAVPVLHAQQDSTPLQPGTRIRVRMSNHLRPLIGTYLHRTDSTLVVGTDSGRVTVALEDVTRLWVSRGRHSYATAGLGIGAVVGMGAGALIAAKTTPSQRVSGFGGPDFSPESEGAVAGLFAGILVGTVIGGSIHGERWTSVSFPPARAK